MNQDAGQWACVIGGSGALVGCEPRGGVGVSSGNDGETLSGEYRTQALREGEGYVLLECIVRKMSARVRAAVRGVEQDEIAVEGGKRLGRSGSYELRLGRRGRWSGLGHRGLRETGCCAQNEGGRGLESEGADSFHGEWECEFDCN